MSQARQKYLSCQDCKETWKTDRMVYDRCKEGNELQEVMDHFAVALDEESSELAKSGPEVFIYSYRPKGASKQRRFAVATGNHPNDVVSTHGTKETAVKAGEKLAA